MIYIANPFFGQNEKKYLKETIDTAWISSKGRFIEEFEKQFAKKYGAKYAVCCSNGTSALHLGLIGCGISEGDEVIVPNFTFISSANVIVHCGAKPVFVDVEEDTWNIDPKEIEKKITKRTKAIMPVHIYGHPANMIEIKKIADKHKLLIVEDCAESQGAKVKDKFVGRIGDAGCFSFFGNKIMTTGEGGMCITDSKKAYEKMCLYRSHGMDAVKKYHHPVVGYNYRMTNMQAAIGVGQLENVDKFIKRRDEIKERYEKNLQDLAEKGLVKLMPHKNWATPVCWFYCILVKASKRDELMKFLEKNGVDNRPFFPSISKQKAYSSHNSEKYPVSEMLSKSGLNLPTYYELKDKDIDYVTDQIKSFFK